MTTGPEPIQLSKWWQSDSCRKAYERAEERKRASLTKFLTGLQAKRETLKRDVENWVTQ